MENFYKFKKRSLTKDKSKWLFAFMTTVFLASKAHSSQSAVCKIKIEDLITGTSFAIEETFSFTDGQTKSRKTFNVPQNQFVCTLDFYDIGTGTNLFCESKKSDRKFFVQSDRSKIKEDQAPNRLTMRNEDSFITLHVFCSNKS